MCCGQARRRASPPRPCITVSPLVSMSCITVSPLVSMPSRVRTFRHGNSRRSGAAAPRTTHQAERRWVGSHERWSLHFVVARCAARGRMLRHGRGRRVAWRPGASRCHRISLFFCLRVAHLHRSWCRDVATAAIDGRADGGRGCGLNHPHPGEKGGGDGSSRRRPLNLYGIRYADPRPISRRPEGSSAQQMRTASSTGRRASEDAACAGLGSLSPPPFTEEALTGVDCACTGVNSHPR
uniref:Predicted protein n=1 Tax=Hordeum vulgare subsp. vulgare TaxID=112509 RepID=F2D035_HORVV|nr:predicted protein [Hordeum vulgare subsp. vulgare]